MVGSALAEAEARLAAAGIEFARRDARLLLALALDKPADELSREGARLSERQAAKLSALVNRRAAREPYAFIAGHREFWSLDFEVGPGVLVPRPETETLIEELGRTLGDQRRRHLAICDFGTGSGCLLIAALIEFPKATGLGLDNSPEALRWARRNVEKHCLFDRATLRHQDWTDEMTDQFDVILSNPPYIRHQDVMALAPEVARYEPSSALDGGGDGLEAFRSLAPRIARTLRQDGVAFLEIGAGQFEGVKDVLQNSGLKVERIVKDLAGIGRCIVARPADKQEN
jgi:release factor glutamine methyltransferase